MLPQIVHSGASSVPRLLQSRRKTCLAEGLLDIRNAPTMLANEE